MDDLSEDRNCSQVIKQLGNLEQDNNMMDFFKLIKRIKQISPALKPV